MAHRDKTTQAVTREALAVSNAFEVAALIAILVGLLALGCTATTTVLPANEAVLRDGIPADAGLVFGRIRLEGGRKPLLEGSGALVELRNDKTGKRFTHTLEKTGDFFLLLPTGDYTITAVWSGFQGAEARTDRGPIAFAVPPGRTLYLGTLLIRLPSANQEGEVAMVNEFDAATRRLTARYPTLRLDHPPLKWLLYPSGGAVAPARVAVPPAGTGVPIQIVNDLILAPATLNRAQAATLLVDTGATHSLLTPAVARRLGISPSAAAPRRTIHLIGGQSIDVPFVTLSTLQVGDAVVENLEVGIHLIHPGAPIVDGLLGSDFLGRFQMTVDRSARQLRIEPRNPME
jgi:hypothetical protein